MKKVLTGLLLLSLFVIAFVSFAANDPPTKETAIEIPTLDDDLELNSQKLFVCADSENNILKKSTKSFYRTQEFLNTRDVNNELRFNILADITNLDKSTSNRYPRLLSNYHNKIFHSNPFTVTKQILYLPDIKS